MVDARNPSKGNEISKAACPSDAEVGEPSAPCTPNQRPHSDPEAASSESPHRHTVLIADDNAILGQYLVQRLAREPDLQIVALVDNISDALREVAAWRPDLVITDLLLREGHGLELIALLKESASRTKTLVWTRCDKTLFAEHAFRAGAAGYVNEQEPVESLIRVIRQIL